MQLHIRMSVCGVVVCLGILLVSCGCGPSEPRNGSAAGRDALTVYVPCGMEMPFMELKDTFQDRHPGTTVKLLLDNSHILAQRVIEKGERPDVLISPGAIEMEQLLKSGHVASEDVTHFGKYELVLFGPRSNPAQIAKIADLTSESVKTIAVADPEKTSVGYYTRETLEGLGLWDKVQDKVVITGDPSKAYKHVAREKADASFAYRSCPLKTAPDKLAYSKVRILESVPAGLYGPAYASVAVLKGARNRDLAEAFVALIMSDDGQAALAKYEVPCLDSLDHDK